MIIYIESGHNILCMYSRLPGLGTTYDVIPLVSRCVFMTQLCREIQQHHHHNNNQLRRGSVSSSCCSIFSGHISCSCRTDPKHIAGFNPRILSRSDPMFPLASAQVIIDTCLILGLTLVVPTIYPGTASRRQ